MALSPDGSMLASGAGYRDYRVWLWRVRDGVLLRTLSHGDSVLSLAWSPDGKTVATGLMARWFKDNAITAITMKMAQTGCSDMSDDILEHRKLAGQELVEEDAMGITCPYVFPVPCSPHLAARLEALGVERR